VGSDGVPARIHPQLAQGAHRLPPHPGIVGGQGSLEQRTQTLIAGTGDEGLRPLFERALAANDAWVRWKAVRALSELGVDPSRDAIAAHRDDSDFQVRFEVERALRSG